MIILNFIFIIYRMIVLPIIWANMRRIKRRQLKEKEQAKLAQSNEIDQKILELEKKIAEEIKIETEAKEKQEQIEKDLKVANKTTTDA